MLNQENEIFFKLSGNSYVMFIPPDMSFVKALRKELKNSLEQNDFSSESISQIILAADEAITNSISANVSNDSEETIICKWRIKDYKFSMLILDYGKGFKLSETNLDEEPKNLDSYISNIKEYQKDQERKLPYSGETKSHKNMGKGLKIIRSLMDTVKILYHCNGKITENPNESKINGSILELEFNALNHPPKN